VVDLKENDEIGSTPYLNYYSMFEVDEIAVSENGGIVAGISRANAIEPTSNKSTEGVMFTAWDVLRDKLYLAKFNEQSQITDLALNTDGSILAAGFGDGSIHLFDTFQGLEVKVLSGHTDVVEGVSFNQGSEKLISVSRDGTMRIWEVE
jgi:WD40 repeat protein